MGSLTTLWTLTGSHLSESMVQGLVILVQTVLANASAFEITIFFGLRRTCLATGTPTFACYAYPLPPLTCTSVASFGSASQLDRSGGWNDRERLYRSQLKSPFRSCSTSGRLYQVMLTMGPVQTVLSSG
ncbi:hypothetical protein EDB85DRAFT_1915259 [Lactarius pseudohatsudake]|nr:hypothetical protein EDB85DRAFT_1915259 [Lactarius pseudohatsudake]